MTDQAKQANDQAIKDEIDRLNRNKSKEIKLLGPGMFGTQTAYLNEYRQACKDIKAIL